MDDGRTMCIGCGLRLNWDEGYKHWLPESGDDCAWDDVNMQYPHGGWHIPGPTGLIDIDS